MAGGCGGKLICEGEDGREKSRPYHAFDIRTRLKASRLTGSKPAKAGSETRDIRIEKLTAGRERDWEADIEPDEFVFRRLDDLPIEGNQQGIFTLDAKNIVNLELIEYGGHAGM